MQKPAYSVTEVLTMIGISRSKFYQLVNGRQIKVRKIGNRSIILAGDLEEFLRSLPTMGDKK
jgi:predicted DNA-binding transcriptional regulator AlpA